MILVGYLESIGVSNNKIIYGIPNYILSPSKLQYVVKKCREATFMRIARFFYNYPCSMSCKKVESADIGRLVKAIAFFDG